MVFGPSRIRDVADDLCVLYARGKVILSYDVVKLIITSEFSYFYPKLLLSSVRAAPVLQIVEAHRGREAGSERFWRV
jgi:hypothetical protein